LASNESLPAVGRNVPLASLNTLGIGGSARWFARARTSDEVAAVHRWCEERRLDLFVLGGGSNIVVADSGFDGLVLQVGVEGIECVQRGDDTRLRAGAGEPWDRVVSAAVERGLAGLECLSGIPGSVGGTPVQNVGAYGQEVGDRIEQVTAFDRRAGTVVTLVNADCRFAYRMSRFKNEDADRYIVCEVALTLRPGAPTVTYPDLVSRFEQHAGAAPTIAAVRAAVLEIRRRKGMVLDSTDPDTRSVGSFFMNPMVSADVHRTLVAAARDDVAPGFLLPDGRVKVPAAWLIERAGFKRGHDGGCVGLSTKHPLALVTRSGATARDVVQLATRIKRQVMDRFGIALRPEPVFVGFNHDPDVQYLREG
jgi:UDP-N-acetylmuramate dehydrogenase